MRTILFFLLGVYALVEINCQVLTPPIFNLARNRRIEATSTCGVGVSEPELFCKLTGGTADTDGRTQLIQGQVCDVCDPRDPIRSHPVEFAIDGSERWWQSPPLSRGSSYNEVNLTIDMGQEFHVAYVFIRMANSPRPGVWVLERSRDHGKTFLPWAYFADTDSDCARYFGRESLKPLLRDDSVRCFTRYSKVVPLEDGQIPFSLLNGRPSAGNFFNSSELQQWTRATSVRLRLLRTKTLLGHLMSVAQQVPTVTRRYFYSVKDISIGGRCVCNGHADLCDPAIDDPGKLICRCQHNTCGEQCEYCCPPFVQKQWRQATGRQFHCQPCNCYNHADECVYNETVDLLKLSVDINGAMEGGGVCQRCRDHTTGINCHQCEDGYFRPLGIPLNSSEVCQACECDVWYSTGNCAEGTGQCECRAAYLPPDCDSCSYGYYGYPDCRPCDCHLNGTRGSVCEVGGGQCPCKQNFSGKNCRQCAPGFFSFPQCLSCECNPIGAVSSVCDLTSGQCNCRNNYGSRQCDVCQDGYFRYPECLYCKCDVTGTEEGVCNKSNGVCLCRHGYGGERCDRCDAGFFGYPDCQPCQCNEGGSISKSCSSTGKCQCLRRFSGQNCQQCSPGFFTFPECLPCQCHPLGSDGVTCSDSGICQCHRNFDGQKCNRCKENFYNFPLCEACNCDPRGVTSSFSGCDVLEHLGELCQCRDRVTGRTCDTCRPLYWNLQLNNPDGCQECLCNRAGTVGGLGSCDTETGQCVCKPHVMSQLCDQCQLGTYQLSAENMLGCQTCECDVGGALSDVCDQYSGQCSCRPRVTGAHCSQPIRLHYFPTLHQHQYEAEDGRTPAISAVRFGYDEDQFNNFSWRGYAVFSSLQREILHDIWVEKPSLYRLVLKYVNPTESPIIADIRLSSDRLQDISQEVQVRFDPSKSGVLVTASGENGGLPTPLVLNPGRWTVVIHSRGNGLLLDYFVLLPAAYYEATILQQKASGPCQWKYGVREFDERQEDQPSLCVQYSYPDLRWASTVSIESTADSSTPQPTPTSAVPHSSIHEVGADASAESPDLQVPGLEKLRTLLRNDSRSSEDMLQLLETHPQLMNQLNNIRKSIQQQQQQQQQQFPDHLSTDEQYPDGFISLEEVQRPEVQVSLVLQSPGYHVLILSFVTPPDSEVPRQIQVSVNTKTGEEVGVVSVHRCDYSVVCRQVISDSSGRVLHVNLHPSNSSLILQNKEKRSIWVKSITAVPSEDWSTNYVVPRPYCIKQSGVCMESTFTSPPHSDKVEFSAVTLEEQPDNDTGSARSGVLANTTTVKIGGVVTQAGLHVIIVHYKQPNHPGRRIPVLLESGRFQQASLKFEHCPFLVGCRAVVQDSRKNVAFNIDKHYTITMEGAGDEQLQLEHLLVVPSELYSWQLLEPLLVDRAAMFLQQCGSNHLMIDSSQTDFCRAAVYSLTAEYNNGALACGCDIRGALSFECEPLGGQCLCREGVIGRRCHACRTGYFGFPDCRPCTCPSTALCDQVTGECICPARVTGEHCDRCVALTYGFDPLVGCSQCSCHRLGVQDGDLQCDTQTGQCPCKPNVVSRSCDRCRPGHWEFPYCRPCECNNRGTSEQICSQETAECFCKPNVEGIECDQCTPGTFNLVDSNPDGCTRCFCFGKSDTCTSALLLNNEYNVLDEEKWSVTSLDTVAMSVSLAVQSTKLSHYPDHIVLDMDNTQVSSTVYLVLQFADNNLLTSYGAALKYRLTVDALADGEISSVENIHGADVVLVGANITLFHKAYPDLSRNQFIEVNLPLEARFFQRPSGEEASRDELMQVLSAVEGLLMRAHYLRAQTSARFSAITLPRPDVVSLPDRSVITPSQQQSSVEQCSCPSSYAGLSCEKCASGHYRTESGPFGGYCVPCNCNGHSNVCDPDTGVCQDCKHNTTGNHCELCKAGFHGDATHGTMYDCLICACPLPLLSNNFAESCHPTPGGAGIACQCKLGYSGERCEYCAPGYFGRPDLVGQSCQPCQCSGNIDVTEIGACDRETGQCLLCLNNTAGNSCELCSQGFYGDAVLAKNCQACTCDRCGTDQCDTSTGQCTCRVNVEGVKCDRCIADHWGFATCQGCDKCSCAAASESTSCDLTSGQCRCRPGVTGRTCDVCAPGYWNYSPSGCQSCSCNSEYAEGVGCNPLTGQCECLPGVRGPKCDHCPPRWVFVPGEGCKECDTCVDDLLDTTAGLHAIVKPIISEFESYPGTHFINQKLSVINGTYYRLKPEVSLIVSGGVDVNPLQLQVSALEREVKSRQIQSENVAARAIEVKNNAAKVEDEAVQVEKKIGEAVSSARNIVRDIISLAQGLQVGSGPQISLALTEAQSLLDEIKSRDLNEAGNRIGNELNEAIALLDRVRQFSLQVDSRVEEASLLKSRLAQLEERLSDLRQQAQQARKNALDTLELVSSSRGVKIRQNTASILEKSEKATATLDETADWLKKADQLLTDTRKRLSELKIHSESLASSEHAMQARLDDTGFAVEDVEDLSLRAQQHASDLLLQAQMLDSMLSDTRAASDGAVRAANSYGDIVTAISNALSAARTALDAAEKSSGLSEGVEISANESSQASAKIMQEASELLVRVTNQLKPLLHNIKSELDTVDQLQHDATQRLTLIDKSLTDLGEYQLREEAADAVQKAAAADEKAGLLRTRVSAVSDQLADKLDTANGLAREMEAARKAIKLSSKQISEVENSTANIERLITSVSNKSALIEKQGKQVGDKISELRRKVSVARQKANSIGFGVEFDGEVTLRLHNPEGLERSAISNEISFFFRTSQLNGFLLYLGNEVGTKEHLVRTTSDDFVAVEVIDGNVNVLVELGSGTQRIINNLIQVSDGAWHKLTISRKGRRVKVLVTTEDENMEEKVHEVESILTGSKSALNLDQARSVLYVGGFPITAKVQESVRYTSFTGAIEELRINDIPTGLWNFDSQTKLKHKGAFRRNTLVESIPTSGLRFNGAGYAAFLTRSFDFAKRLSVQLRFKTFSSDGLLFLAGRGTENFVSIELNDGALVYQYSLGDGVLRLSSTGPYSDGQWHTVDGSREERRGALTVDSILADQGESPGQNAELSVSSMMYFGGYPADVPYPDVVNRNFEGCITDVSVSGLTLNLGRNDESLGVLPGCPQMLLSDVSFVPDLPGYIVQPVEGSTIEQLSFKFRTATADGLLVYASNKDQTSSFSLSLNAGSLVLTCVPGGEVSTANFFRYNDNRWHVISVIVSEDNVRMEIDDYETFTLSDLSPGLRLSTNSLLFFGGVPEGVSVAENAAGSVDNLAGCLGDVTFNNEFVNFGLARERRNAIMERCSLSLSVQEGSSFQPGGTGGVHTLLDMESQVIEDSLEVGESEKTDFSAPNEIQMRKISESSDIEKTEVTRSETDGTAEKISRGTDGAVENGHVPEINEVSGTNLDNKTTGGMKTAGGANDGEAAGRDGSSVGSEESESADDTVEGIPAEAHDSMDPNFEIGGGERSAANTLTTAKSGEINTDDQTIKSDDAVIVSETTEQSGDEAGEPGRNLAAVNTEDEEEHNKPSKNTVHDPTETKSIIEDHTESDSGFHASTVHDPTDVDSTIEDHTESDSRFHASTVHDPTVAASAMQDHTESDSGFRASTVHDPTGTDSIMEDHTESDSRFHASTVHDPTGTGSTMGDHTEPDSVFHASTVHDPTDTGSIMEDHTESDSRFHASTVHDPTGTGSTMEDHTETDSGFRASTVHDPTGTDSSLDDLTSEDHTEIDSELHGSTAYDSAESGFLVSTTEEPELPRVDGCALPLRPAFHHNLATFKEHRFGSRQHSRWEFESLPGDNWSEWSFSIEMRTQSNDGIIFYAANSDHSQYISLCVKQGKIFYTLCIGGEDVVSLSTESRGFSDDQWHTVDFDLRDSESKLYVDKDLLAFAAVPGRSVQIDLKYPVFVGGVSAQLTSMGQPRENLQGVLASFVGCLRNMRLNGRDFGAPHKSVAVQGCSDQTESGVFFGLNGGHLKVDDGFIIGQMLDISLRVKPRRLGGVILSIGGGDQTAILQILNDGTISFSVKNSGGSVVEVKFEPRTDHSLCDGQWHSINVVKGESVMAMFVDDFNTLPVFFSPALSGAPDSPAEFFLGGAPSTLGTNSSFAGCISQLNVEGRADIDVLHGEAIGDVSLNTCPTN